VEKRGDVAFAETGTAGGGEQWEKRSLWGADPHQGRDSGEGPAGVKKKGKSHRITGIKFRKKPSRITHSSYRKGGRDSAMRGKARASTQSCGIRSSAGRGKADWKGGLRAEWKGASGPSQVRGKESIRGRW